jgi:hypothetical protein
MQAVDFLDAFMRIKKNFNGALVTERVDVTSDARSYVAFEDIPQALAPADEASLKTSESSEFTFRLRRSPTVATTITDVQKW